MTKIPQFLQLTIWCILCIIVIPLSLKTLSVLKWKDEDGCEQTFRLVNFVSFRWMDFGVLLGYTMNTMEGWKMEYQGNVTVCWNKVMEQWLAGGGTHDYRATWEGLCSLLNDCNLSKAAADLKHAMLECHVHCSFP